MADPTRDLLKMAVIERHTASGGQSLGFIQGIGLQRGALAGTVAHRIITTWWSSVRTICSCCVRSRRGRNGRRAGCGRWGRCAGPTAPARGRSDDNQPVAAVRAGYDGLLAAAAELGSPLHDPFMAMSFMALEVIPKLKLTDMGLVDVERFDFVELFVNE